MRKYSVIVHSTELDEEAITKGGHVDLWSKFLRKITNSWIYLILIFAGSVLAVMIVVGLISSLLLLVVAFTYLTQP